MLNQHIEMPLEKIAAFAKEYPIRRLALFGSVLGDDFRPDSDVDVLVEFDLDSNLTYLDMAHMEAQLSEILGRAVDLREPAEISRYFRQDVVNLARPLYVRK